jgi:hypothetical protein
MLVILGDFNAGQRFNQTTPDSEIGIIRGFETSQQNDDLFDAHMMLGERATHVGGRELDRILVASPLQPRIASIETRQDLSIRSEEDSGCDGVCYDEPIASQDLSDHFPLVLTLTPALIVEEPVDDEPVDDEPGTEETLNARLASIEAEIQELRREIEEIKQLILELHE